MTQTFEQLQQEWMNAGGPIEDMAFQYNGLILVGHDRMKFKVCAKKSPLGNWTIQWIEGCGAQPNWKHFEDVKDAIDYANFRLSKSVTY